MKKLFRFLIIILALVMVIFIVIDTFALLQSEGNAVVQEDVGKWIIKVNDNLISGREDATFTVDNFHYSVNYNVKDGNLAPGRQAYFDITLDPTGTDVAVRYDIEFDFSSASTDTITATVSDLTSGNVVRTGENTYSGIIGLAAVQAGITNTIRVTVVWVNDEDNNEEDTALGINKNSKISIPVTVHAVQYTGESLTPYNP